ncbi:hypothetical protein FEM03_03165 [Phragmitibacter flavus]|uniref:DUF697 domain-containing protein n=1 Tax=Phragmitibacter flavus TaxID=2576071 RepID=A0A5R8KJE7_9BACT|nr:hypothetical protein [Phragmitibacter flavus]TLD72371.1 hypothetical protein FEM03_03165 [Phragmitibacter flavus]
MITEDTPKPAERLVRRLVDDAESVARRDPTKAVATAFGVGILLNILPTRFIVGTVAAVATTVIRPTLLTLGVIKAFEIYLDQTKTNQPNLPHD